MQLARLIHLPAVDGHEPREVARVADVHGVGKRIARRNNLFVNPRCEKAREGIVVID